MCCDLLGVRAYRVLIGACNPMLRPIHVFRHLLGDHLYVASDGRAFETSQSAVAYHYQGELDKGATPDLTPLIPATDSYRPGPTQAYELVGTVGYVDGIAVRCRSNWLKRAGLWDARSERCLVDPRRHRLKQRIGLVTSRYWLLPGRVCIHPSCRDWNRQACDAVSVPGERVPT